MALSNDLLTLVGLALAGVLTLVTLSYAFGDNPLFRLALYLFIGISAGYAGAIAVEEVITPQLITPLLNLLSGTAQIDLFDLAMRTFLTLLLLTKLWPRTTVLGNPATALLVGVGAALAVVGAVQGTILPQVGAASTFFDTRTFELALQGGYYTEATGLLMQGFTTLLATIGTLAYFHFGARSRGKLDPERNIIVDALAWVGRIFIAITFATLFVGVLLAALTALIERLDFLQDLISLFFIGT